MNASELVVGRLYKVKNKTTWKDYETSEKLCMFLRISGKKASLLSMSGEIVSVDLEEIITPRMDYLELFSDELKDEIMPLMKDFLVEYQKYENIRLTKTGYKASGIDLNKLDMISNQIKMLNVSPMISMAVESYFDVYKDLGLSYSEIEDVMITFINIDEWDSTFNKLRGFDFKDRNLSPKKFRKYSSESLMIHHLYTNLFIKPNFKNIKAEWLDMLMSKMSMMQYSSTVLSTLDKLRWKCISANAEIVNNNFPKMEPDRYRYVDSNTFNNFNELKAPVNSFDRTMSYTQYTDIEPVEQKETKDFSQYMSKNINIKNEIGKEKSDIVNDSYNNSYNNTYNNTYTKKAVASYPKVNEYTRYTAPQNMQTNMQNLKEFRNIEQPKQSFSFTEFPVIDRNDSRIVNASNISTVKTGNVIGSINNLDRSINSLDRNTNRLDRNSDMSDILNKLI